MRRRLPTAAAIAVALTLALAVPAFAAVPAASPSPTASVSPQPTSQGPAIGLPTFDPQKLVYQTLAQVLYSMDKLLIGEMEQLWNPMVTGTDDLNGTTTFGAFLIIDNSKLKSIWGISFGIATGSLLVLLFTLSAVIWMVREGIGVSHDLTRFLLYFLLTVVVMGASFFLISQLLVLDNAMVSAVNTQVVVELRSLPAYQGLGLNDPSAIQDARQLVDVIALFLIGLFIGLELAVLFIVYFLRIILIWVLVVIAPFVLAVGILPGARGMVVYWLRLLLVAVFFKFVNVIVFVTFVLMAATSSIALFNLLIVGTMLFFMLLVPLTLIRAMAEPHIAAASYHDTWSRITRYEPFVVAGSQLRQRLASRR